MTARGASVAESLVRRQHVVITFFDCALDYELDGQPAYRFGYTLPNETLETRFARSTSKDVRNNRLP